MDGIDILTELVSGASDLRLLVNSRELLNLQGEWLFDVGGLPLPEGQESKSELEGRAAELFVEHARWASLSFDASDGDYQAIFEICRLVKGFRLGIELSVEIFRQMGGRAYLSQTQTYLAQATVMKRPAAAKRSFLDALRMSSSVPSVPISFEALLGLGKVAVEDGDDEAAIEKLKHVQIRPSSSKDTSERALELLSEYKSQFTFDRGRQVQQNRPTDGSFEEMVE